jgi:hypothetical protein
LEDGDARSVVHCNELVIKRGSLSFFANVPHGNEAPLECRHLSFLAKSPFSPASSLLAHATSEGNEGDSPYLPTANDCTTGNNEIFAHSDVYFTNAFSSHDDFDASDLDKLCVNMLPIEQNPDFVNLVGSHLELGKESDSNLTRDEEEDDIYGPAVVGNNQLGAASLFPGF